MVELKAITEDNFIDAFNLKLAPEQERFVSHPIRSLAQAYVYREQCQPFGIYADGKMVGYVMVIYDYDVPEYDIWHMMIDESMQGRGYGSAALDRVLDYIRTKPFGTSDRVALTCNKENPVARKLYEDKGFVATGVEDEDEIELVLTMITNDYTIRLEKKEEQRTVENLVRESFWNVYRPGCSEHYVIHVLRDDPAFVKELDFVMERDGALIGQNMFMRTVINADDGRVVPVLTMGPIGITPELKRHGYGKKLLDYSLEQAAAMGFGAVLFEGNIGFYGKSGFDYARNFGIRYHDLPEGADDSFFLCKELIPGYLDGITGVYQTPQGYYVDDSDVEAFDREFPPKVKLKLPGQIF